MRDFDATIPWLFQSYSIAIPTATGWKASAGAGLAAIPANPIFPRLFINAKHTPCVPSIPFYRTHMTTFDRNQPLVGITGATHDSSDEAQASFRLAPMGIMRCTETYPVTFKDKTGTPFTAKSDFRCQASGTWFEFKSAMLNSKTTFAAAKKAVATVRRDEAMCVLSKGSLRYRLLDSQWCHSRYKQAVVVNALTPAKVVLVFKHAPGDDAAKRLAKAGIFWRTLDNVSVFALYLRLAAAGLDVGFTASTRRADWDYHTGPWHAFGSTADGTM